MFFGHIPLAYLAQRLFKTELVPTMSGALFPDVVDKSLCEVLHITPSGRMWAHTLLSFGLSTALVRIVAGKRTAFGWAVGYLSHFVGDVPGPIPFLYPFKSYDFKPSPGLEANILRFIQNGQAVGKELILVLAAMAISLRG